MFDKHTKTSGSLVVSRYEKAVASAKEMTEALAALQKEKEQLSVSITHTHTHTHTQRKTFTHTRRIFSTHTEENLSFTWITHSLTYTHMSCTLSHTHSLTPSRTLC